MYFIFLEHKSPGLHFPTNDIGLPSAPEFLFTSARRAFRPFKVIQGR